MPLDHTNIVIFEPADLKVVWANETAGAQVKDYVGRTILGMSLEEAVPHGMGYKLRDLSNRVRETSEPQKYEVQLASVEGVKALVIVSVYSIPGDLQMAVFETHYSK